MSKPETILIVGGGVAGMTASAALAQQGFKVTLLESAPQFGEIGAGLTLTPNAMKGLDFIGICEEAAAVAVEPTRQRIQHWQDGRTLVAMDRSTQRAKYGAPYITVHRADLHGVMTRAAERSGVEMIAGAQVVSSEGTTVTLADGRQFSADVLVGADGVKSVIRQRFGERAAAATIWYDAGAGFGGRGIYYAGALQAGRNSYNEWLTVEDDGYELRLKPIGMAMTGRRDEKLSPEQAAEYLWDVIMQRFMQ